LLAQNMDETSCFQRKCFGRTVVSGPI
jgi:hypothetical protein